MPACQSPAFQRVCCAISLGLNLRNYNTQFSNKKAPVRRILQVPHWCSDVFLRACSCPPNTPGGSGRTHEPKSCHLGRKALFVHFMGQKFEDRESVSREVVIDLTGQTVFSFPGSLFTEVTVRKNWSDGRHTGLTFLFSHSMSSLGKYLTS